MTTKAQRQHDLFSYLIKTFESGRKSLHTMATAAPECARRALPRWHTRACNTLVQLDKLDHHRLQRWIVEQDGATLRLYAEAITNNANLDAPAEDSPCTAELFTPTSQ